MGHEVARIGEVGRSHLLAGETVRRRLAALENATIEYIQPHRFHRRRRRRLRRSGHGARADRPHKEHPEQTQDDPISLHNSPRQAGHTEASTDANYRRGPSRFTGPRSRRVSCVFRFPSRPPALLAFLPFLPFYLLPFAFSLSPSSF